MYDNILYKPETDYTTNGALLLGGSVHMEGTNLREDIRKKDRQIV